MRIAMLSILLPLLLAGCVVTSEREGLPTGVTLLGSEKGYCDGPLEIESDPDLVVDEGESTTVAVDDDDIGWRCMAAYSERENDFNCPDGTSYIRITREDDEDEFDVECFGG